MPQFRKKPVVIDAEQWLKNGDHSRDNTQDFIRADGLVFKGEGHVVRYYRRPDDDGERLCQHCGMRMHEHGWIDTLEGGHIVCPGDWIITGVNGEMYPCKPDVFAKTYDPA
jgi:hypothetical protein